MDGLADKTRHLDLSYDGEKVLNGTTNLVL